MLSLAWFAPIFGALLLSPVTGTPWWQAIPLGLVERGLVISEVLAVIALGVLGAQRDETDPESPTGHPGADRANCLIADGPTRQQPPTNRAPDATQTAACSGPKVALPAQDRRCASQLSPLFG